MTSCHVKMNKYDNLSYANRWGDTVPTQTFFHLPKEKQKTLLKAAINEFTQYSFENASINQIIKEASIPRGSFYMYFRDKEDL